VDITLYVLPGILALTIDPGGKLRKNTTSRCQDNQVFLWRDHPSSGVFAVLIFLVTSRANPRRLRQFLVPTLAALAVIDPRSMLFASRL
jgi:hypothetical protein